jgi:hypothetical protein
MAIASGKGGHGGMGVPMPSLGLLSNPYRVPSRMTGSQLSRMASGSGFTTVSPEEFARRSSASRFASSADVEPLFGQSGVLTRAGGLLNPARRTENPDDDIAERMYGDKQGGGGKMSRIRDLLSGESGAAIGGGAQAAASVLGSFLTRRTERERLKEEQRRQRIIEENNRRAQELLIPMLQSELSRPRG